MIRFAGLAVLLLSAVSYSFVLVKNENRKLSQIKEICALILHIRNHIESFMTPLGTILRSYNGYGDAFCDFAETAKEHDLLYAAEHCRLFVDEETVRLLLEFSRKIGGGYKEDQLRLCDYYHKRIQEIYSNAKEENQKKLKMYRTLPIMSALSIALMLF